MFESTDVKKIFKKAKKIALSNSGDAQEMSVQLIATQWYTQTFYIESLHGKIKNIMGTK